VPRFSSIDEVGIAYYKWGRPTDGPTDGPRSRPPVVLLHGFAVNTTITWVQTGVVDALVGVGHQVIAVDARGHGRSDHPHDPASYGEQTMSLDLRRLLDVLELDDVDLVGYSMGAVVALITAAADARVRRLVVGGVGAGVVEVGGVDTRAIPQPLFVAALLADDTATIEPAGQGVRALADSTGADRYALAAQASRWHNRPIALDRISAPTLVLAGVDDPLAARPEALAAAIQAARLTVLTGNHVTAVSDPAFIASILNFLA
jgi:pimeloyl-ACP methyl ester carboxylesterase